MESMGQKFRAAREKKKMTVSRAAALTRIMVQHIEMMESDDFSRMPAPTYAKGFIRIYSDLLGLDPVPLVQEYIDRHLNTPKKEDERPTRGDRAPATPAEAEGSSSGNENLLALLEKIKSTLVPQLPRIIMAVVVLLLLVGIVRCTARLVTSSAKDDSGPALLDQRAIMKEPPVRYLELPDMEDAQP